MVWFVFYTNMAEENDANAANVAELQAHINLAAARAQSLQPGSKQAEQNVTDLQDYYERLVQIRRMTIETLQETSKETAVAHALNVRLWKVCTGVCVLGAVAVVMIFAPDVANTVSKTISPYFTIDRLLTHFLVGILIMWGGRQSFK